MRPDILDHFAEQLPEETRQERSPQVEALCRVVITVILSSPAHGDQQQPVHNVAEEESLQQMSSRRGSDRVDDDNL